MSSRMGRRRLPPAPAMKSPISRMRDTGESSWRAMASSMARISGPTARTTRSLRSASRSVGAFMDLVERPSADDDAVLDLDLVAGGHALKLDHGELLLHLGDAARGHLLVELAQELAGDRMDDGDLVAPHTDLRPELDPVLAVEIDDDAARVDEDDEAPIGRGGRSHRLGAALARRVRHPLGRRSGRLGGHGDLLTRTDAAASRRGAVLGHDLRRGDEARLAEHEGAHRGRDLVLFDPDVLGLAGHVGEARILDEQPLGLGRLDFDARIIDPGQAHHLAQTGPAAGTERDGDDDKGDDDAWWHTHAHKPPEHSRFDRINPRAGAPTGSAARPPRRRA